MKTLNIHVAWSAYRLSLAKHSDEIVRVWIKGDYNLADSMIKHNENKALDYIIMSNKLHIKAERWVEYK